MRVDYSSYAARPARIGSRVLVRVFEHHLEIRDLSVASPCCARTLLRRSRAASSCPTTNVLFNPSRETRRILTQAKAIGPATEQLCQSLFDSEGRVGQRTHVGHRRPGQALSAPA